MVEQYLQTIRMLLGKQDVTNEAIALAILGVTFALTALVIVGGALYSLAYTFFDQPTRVAHANAQATIAKATAQASAAASAASAKQAEALAFVAPKYPPDYVQTFAVPKGFTRRVHSSKAKATVSTESAERVKETDGRLQVEIAGSKRDLDKGYVYIIKGANAYKIGKAKNIQERLKQLSTGHEHGLTVYHSIASNAMGRAEASLHKRFADLRVRGEWFNLGETELAYIKTIARIDITEAVATNGTTPQEQP